MDRAPPFLVVVVHYGKENGLNKYEKCHVIGFPILIYKIYNPVYGVNQLTPANIYDIIT